MLTTICRSEDLTVSPPVGCCRWNKKNTLKVVWNWYKRTYIFSLFYCLLDLSCGECDVISLYFMCCSVNVSVCLVCCVFGSDIYMCIMNRQFELFEFVFNYISVDLPYNEISLTFTAGSVCCV